MSVEKRETPAESRIEWLDEELRQTKAALHKVEHELEQALNQIWNLESGLRKLEEGLSDAAGNPAAVAGIHEELRQLRGQTDQLRDRQNALASQGEELGRQQKADLQRERQERASLLKQVESAGRSLGEFESRVQHLEESLRHIEEAVAELRLSQQTLVRDVGEITNRAARNLEAAVRLEHQLDAQAGDIEALQKRDDQLQEELTLYDERSRLAVERVDRFEQHLSLPLEIKEQLDRARFERQQMSERLGKQESAVDDLLERTTDFVQGLARVDQRTQSQAATLLELAEELRQQRERVVDQLKRLVRVMERQRRRQAEALAQEIKELSRSEFDSQQ